MTKKFKKDIKCLLLTCLAFVSVLCTIQFPIRSAGHTATKSFLDGINYQATKGAWTAYGQGFLLEMDKDAAFCVNPQTEVIDGGGYSESEFNSSLGRELSIIAYEGFYKNRNKSDVKNYRFATNLMIWERMGWNVTASGFDYAKYKTAIQKSIDKHSTKPSFHNNNITLNVGESITLTDENSVFNEFHFVSSDGLQVEKKGNKLIITATANAKENAKIKFNKIPEECIGTSLIYQKSGSQDMVKFFVTDPLQISVNVHVNKFGALRISKEDEDGNKVPNTSFKLSKNSDMSTPIGTYTTGTNGSVAVDELLPGAYFIQEISVPSHLVLDKTVNSVIVEANKTVQYTAKNNWVKGKIKLRKLDPESKKQVAGATYAIYNTKGQELERLVTTATGVVESGYLRFGDYTVKEVIAPSGYILNKTSYPVTINNNEQVVEVTGHDYRVKGRIELVKQDGSTGDKAQGEATLQGAVYELKARNVIKDPADQSQIYAKDGVVATLTTDANASAKIDDLYLGDYYLKEKTPSNGYTLDDTIYNISLTYENAQTAIVVKKQTVKERVKAQAFQLIKASDNHSGEMDILSGVEFTIKSQADIQAYGSWEKAPVAKNAQGKTAAILVTDKNGYARSEELPYGTYVVRETKVPEDHYQIPDFTVQITEDSREPQSWRIFNDEKFRAVAAIVKKDQDSGNTIRLAGAEFKIKDIRKNEYVGYWAWNPLPHYVDSWTTDETGTVMTAEELSPGEYLLEEVKAPHGYTINTEPVKFRIGMNEAYETLPDGSTPVITVTQTDVSVKGRITVEKRGEVLKNVITDKMGNKHFSYEEQGLSDACYQIKAAEDILDPSNNGHTSYKKGSVVEKLCTGKDGKAGSKELPLGKYSVEEITAPQGYVLDDKAQEVELTYKDQETSLVFGEAGFRNERQKIDIRIHKKDAEQKTPLEHARFALYAKKDIYSYNGKLLVKADEVIETADSDEDGLVRFTVDLPLSEYEIKEIEAPAGYASYKDTLHIDGNYKGQDTAVITYEKEVWNEQTKVDIFKQDITDSSEIEGAYLEVYEKNNPGMLVDSWISGSDGKDEHGSFKPHRIQGLHHNKTYVLHEEQAPHGFAVSQDVEFTVSDTGHVQSVVMKDELVFGRLTWTKRGEVFTRIKEEETPFGIAMLPVWTTDTLPHHDITIYAAEDIRIGNTTYYKQDEKVEVLTSDKDAISSKHLPVGNYFYKETAVDHGYLMDTEKHYFRIEDSKTADLQEVTSSLTNKRPKVQIDCTKVLEEQKLFINKDAYKDVVFGIYAKEPVKNRKEKIVIPENQLVSITGIDQQGHLASVPDLPDGSYFLKELKTNAQYKLDDKEYPFEITYHGSDVARYTVRIDELGTVENKLARGSIIVKKMDAYDTKKIMKDIVFEVSKDADMKEIIVEAVTDKESAAYFSDLEVGTYYIREKQQVSGYAVNDHIYEVTVEKDGDVLEIHCVNKPIEMEFSKVDIASNEELPGAELTVTDKKTGEVIDSWVSTDKPHKIRYLVEGKEYVLTESTAPSGYEKAERITFRALDGNKITMKDKKKLLLPATGDATRLDVYVILIAAAFACIVAFGYCKLRQKK